MKDLWGKSLKLKDSLTLIEVEESGALLDTEKKCCYDLNTTAFFLVNLMEDGCPFEILLEEMVAGFNVDEETARNDIDTLVEKLINLDCVRIIKIVNEHPAVARAKEGNILYETPAIEYNSELVVACAATPI